MKLTVGIPILNQKEATIVTLNSLIKNQTKEIEYILVDNGSTPKIEEWLNDFSFVKIIRNEVNVGLPKALNQILDVATGDYVFFTHNDIEMFNPKWDVEILKCIDRANLKKEVGVAGFFGAMGIGTPDIYVTPYSIEQLVRTNPIAGSKCRLKPEIHHHLQFSSNFIQVAVLDGFSLIVKKNSPLRFEENFGLHHMYDNDICLQAYKNNMQVICINLDIIHYGGKTDVNEDWTAGYGKTKQEVHSEAHPPFYEKWRGVLPFRL